MSGTHAVALKVLCIIAVAALAAACDRGDLPTASAAAAPVAAAAASSAPESATADTTPVEAEPDIPLLERSIAYGETPTRNLMGFLVMPADAAEPLPGILVIHDSYGLRDGVKAATRRLAAHGYVVLAVDLYGGATASTPAETQPLMKALLADPDGVKSNLTSAYEYLEKYALSPRIASLGWSLGGGWSLQLALMFPDQLDAVAMYYGQVVNRESALETLKMPVLGFFGGADESIPVRDVQYFRQTLSTLGKPAEVLIYPRVGHGFADANDASYDAKAASESWQKTIAFLDENLRPMP